MPSPVWPCPIWFIDLTFHVPMQYCSLQHQTLLPSPVTSTTGCCFCFGSISSFFLELFLHCSSVAYWAPADLGGSSFSVLSFCLFILFMGFSRQEYWSVFAIPFSCGPRFVHCIVPVLLFSSVSLHIKFSTYYFFLPTLCSLYIWQAFLQGNEHTLPEIPDPSFMPLFCLHHPYLLLFKARAVSPVDPAFPPYLLSFQACFSIIHQTFWSPSQIQFLFLLSSPTAGKYLLRSAKTLYTDDIAVLLVIVIKVNHLNIYHRGLIKLP